MLFKCHTIVIKDLKFLQNSEVTFSNNKFVMLLKDFKFRNLKI